MRKGVNEKRFKCFRRIVYYTETFLSLLFMEKNIIRDKYKLEGVLGRGHFGTVCKARILKTQEPVAVKLEIRSSDHVVSLRHESMILRHLNQFRIANIPQIHYYGIQDPYACLVLTYYHEKSLDYYALELEHVHEWWTQACHILKDIHTQGIVHRDLKPSHFMKVTHRSLSGQETTEWHLIDFGLATVYTNHHSQIRDTIVGSPNWISVYIHEGHEPTRRDDYITLIYIFLDLCLQTVNNGLPWIDKVGGFHQIACKENQWLIEQKSWISLKYILDKSILNTEEKTLFGKLLFLGERLQMKDKPPYDQVCFEF